MKKKTSQATESALVQEIKSLKSLAIGKEQSIEIMSQLYMLESLLLELGMDLEKSGCPLPMKERIWKVLGKGREDEI